MVKKNQIGQIGLWLTLIFFVLLLWFFCSSCQNPTCQNPISESANQDLTKLTDLGLLAKGRKNFVARILVTNTLGERDKVWFGTKRRAMDGLDRFDVINNNIPSRACLMTV